MILDFLFDLTGLATLTIELVIEFSSLFIRALFLFCVLVTIFRASLAYQKSIFEKVGLLNALVDI